jgi:Domain of unknown function (DUF4430)
VRRQAPRPRARDADGGRPIERLALAALATALVLVGCGEEPTGSGTAALWVTRDRGERVLLVRKVPAGLTAMQALDREADVEKRYGGRFVQSIEGLEGDLADRRDWFYFVNGIEADRSATEYRLRDGEILWWDYRSWRGRMRQGVVVGAFPEPFRHGYDGKTHPVAVRYEAGLARGARAIGRVLRANSIAPVSVPAPEGASVFLLERHGANEPERFAAALRDESSEAGSAVRFVFAGDALRLAREPGRFRYRYEVRE